MSPKVSASVYVAIQETVRRLNTPMRIFRSDRGSVWRMDAVALVSLGSDS